MTKLLEWLTAASVLGALWISLLTNKIENSIHKDYPVVLLYSPLFLLILFGVYALITVLYRTFTFYTCEDAASELLNEIQEAKKGLANLGYTFPEAKS